MAGGLGRGTRTGAPRVVMAGPALKVRGGISSVASSLLGAWPEDGQSVVYIATHVDGPKLLKTLAAVAGTVGIAFAIVFGRRRVVHLHMSSHASFVRKSAIGRMAKLLRCCLIIHIHGSRFDVYFRESSKSRQRSITRSLESADLVIALSEEWRVRLRRIAPRSNVRVLPNPVSVAEFEPTLEGRYAVPESGGTVLFLGAFGKRKGVYDLLEGIPAVAAERPEVVFEMGGDQEVAEVAGLIEKGGVERNVKMLGWVTGTDKLAAFTRAHIYVLPSYHEGLPIGVLEAMAAGLPVVTTPVGGIPEVVKDGVNGIIITPGDVRALSSALLRLLGDPALRKRMSDANVELARSRHDAPVVAATLCEWYNEIWNA